MRASLGYAQRQLLPGSDLGYLGQPTVSGKYRPIPIWSPSWRSGTGEKWAAVRHSPRQDDGQPGSGRDSEVDQFDRIADGLAILPWVQR
jgi:hypothetical protein